MEDKKHILFIIDSLGCGGAEKSLVSLLPLLDYRRFEVDLLINSTGGVFERYIPKEINRIKLPGLGKIRSLWLRMCQIIFSLLLRVFPSRHGAELRWLSMSSAYPRLMRKYDVAVAYQQGFPTYYLAEKVSAGKKYAWVNVDLKAAGYNPDFNRSFYDKITGVISVSDCLSEVLSEAGYFDSCKSRVIYDILNVNLISRMSQETADKMTVSDDMRLRIVTVGRMVAQKNYALAVETARVLKERGLYFCWYFIGDGNERGMVEDMISEYGLQNCIKLVGMTPNPYPYMANCDIYVQTSSFEGFGLTLCEARILNKPVVSTNFSVVYNQIRDGENGLIAEMTAESIADKIMLLVENESLKNHLIEETKKEVNLTAITESEKVNSLLSE